MSNIILNSLNDNNMKIDNNDILNMNSVYDGAIKKSNNPENILQSSFSLSSSDRNDIIIDGNSNLISDQQNIAGDIWDHQITFEIPSNLDLERIKNLDNFTSLLHRIPSDDIHNDEGNDGIIDGAVSISGYDDINAMNFANILNGHNNDISDSNNLFGKWSITNNDDNSVNSDYQMILNYLWIGIVISLIIMSIVFIVFSCYFYRKFREWKKCNKDIRAQLPNDLYPNGNMNITNGNCLENGYYQMMESPPCYTIATGLPSYDEALMQATAQDQQQHHQYRHNHHYPLHRSIEQQNYIFDTRLMTSWEKPHLTERNYLWDEGNNTFDTTNLVVINNLTDVPNSNTDTHNSNNISTNSINTKEIENFPNTITTNTIANTSTNANTMNTSKTATVTKTLATEFNSNFISRSQNHNESDLIQNYEENENFQDTNKENEQQSLGKLEIEKENDIVSEQNNITASLKDNDCMEIVILS